MNEWDVWADELLKMSERRRLIVLLDAIRDLRVRVAELENEDEVRP